MLAILRFNTLFDLLFPLGKAWEEVALTGYEDVRDIAQAVILQARKDEHEESVMKWLRKIFPENIHDDFWYLPKSGILIFDLQGDDCPWYGFSSYLRICARIVQDVMVRLNVQNDYRYPRFHKHFASLSVFISHGTRSFHLLNSMILWFRWSVD